MNTVKLLDENNQTMRPYFLVVIKIEYKENKLIVWNMLIYSTFLQENMHVHTKTLCHELGQK